ncbi:MAG TPA: hypothetical protein ENN20_07975 [Candidatus Marinimicrobia bacterium]|nr:hypothetical protein [Candidatus Neomarinimicrobiota bacterium]
MKPFSVFLFISVFVLLINAQELIPAWFEELPEAPAGFHFAVGYSGKYFDQSLAREAAISLAVSNLAKQLEARLIFELEEYTDGRLRLLNPSFELSYDEYHVLEINKNFSAVDSSITRDGYFILITYPGGSRRHRNSSIVKKWGSRPEWTIQLPRSEKFNYGIGMVSNYSSWVRAWKDADEYARFDLGKNLKITAQSVHAAQQDNHFVIESKILRQSYNEIIHDSKIIARWYDRENDIYYSLCRQPR